MTKCKYEYEYTEKKKCPHEALDGNDVCYWHEKRDSKNPIEELGTDNFKNLDLVESNLQKAQLEGANFQGAQLENTDLQRAWLVYANFQGAQLEGANFQGAQLEGANFRGAWLYQAKFDYSNLWEAKLDEIVIDEIEADTPSHILILSSYRKACQIYRNLKNYFRNEGIYERSGDYYYREKTVERKIYKQKNKGKYLGSLFLGLLCGYGEKPGRIIYSALTVIIISAILYYGVGIEAYVIEGSSFQVVKISYSSQLTVYENFENLVTCSYFSVVTFTTLGYGDFHPIGASRIIAMVEAFSGVFMLALFVLTMGRKMMR